MGLEVGEQSWESRALRAEGWVRSMEAEGEPLGLPTCPRCKSHNGNLGTQNAYFICCECAKDRADYIVYWLGDGRHPSEQGMSWEDAIMASPWARKRDVERIATARALKGIGDSNA